MTEEEVKGLLKEASEKIKEDFIPKMTNLLMDVFQHGLNKGTEIGVKIGSDKTRTSIKWQTGEPKESGSYLVTMKGMDETFVTYSRYSCLTGWSHSNKVLAWCLLGSIKPYKGETK